jgi:hypothetical protein
MHTEENKTDSDERVGVEGGLVSLLSVRIEFSLLYLEFCAVYGIALKAGGLAIRTKEVVPSSGSRASEAGSWTNVFS